MKKIFIIVFVFLQITLQVQSGFSQNSDIYKSVVTIAIDTLIGCGVIDSGRRSNSKDKDTHILKEVMIKTNAYNLGTGFIYQRNNTKYVITCEHVVFRADSIFGYSADYEKPYVLEFVGADTFYDIAVLKFASTDDTENFEAIDFDFSTQTNEEVKSIGYWRLDGTPSTYSGKILDGDNQVFDTDLPLPKIGFITSDAHTEGGYSGGLLLNKAEKVVGINNARHTVDEISYALQSKIVKRIVDEIIDNGSIMRAYCGIQFSENTKQGCVEIASVIQGSPSEKHRKKMEGQELISINDQPVSSIYEILMLMEKIKPGEQVKFELSTNSVIIKTKKLNRKSLVHIAKHAIAKNDYDKCKELVEKDSQTVIVRNDKEDITAQTAGIEDDLVYCLNSIEQLGAIIRIFSLHRYLEIGHSGEDHNYIEQLKFSENSDRRVLFY